jgi:ArsR family transcriptional regulator, arsenate/arsenite/antimonite-responsive transcriptional repressor
MGLTKSENFTVEQNELANITKALGHPARIAILEYLLKVDACICGDIVNELPLAQPTISQHLKELKNAGIIKGTIEGNAICYCIDEKAMERLKSYFGDVLSTLEKKKMLCS